jgi:hypothetical protein
MGISVDDIMYLIRLFDQHQHVYSFFHSYYKAR